ncbi:glycyl-radical enzyme activating protein [Butyricicoccus faecihominis]|uniref:glycyl-radical enzyme activating protein n=1 Tax=Butyricicoccus faecihominis TaxID=1712515 RepID=UPI00247A1400|nr:glycyl-radical enzyme activating protein [Butyricicoccus faecihominis]MCQ5130074.1 glycyl-radical enzyme activating protein [Butyricicoccus faecihominis]
MTTALVSNIQKCCVHDGPGLRTVVFLMGCPLRCKWCQNPENLATKPIVLFDTEKCARCGRCLPYCPHGCCTLTADGLRFDREACTGCGVCAEHCYIDAKTLCGRRMSVDETYQAVMRDQVFYRDSGGGVTLSGGEPTLHEAFATELFRRLQEAGIHTALETCGFCSSRAMLRIARHTDLFLYDFKALSDEVHRKWTGQSNEQIKENLSLLHEMGKQIIIRVPLIPGVNDGDEFERMLQYLLRMQGLRKLHLLPFHQVGASKYVLSDVGYDMAGVPECSVDYAQEHAVLAQNYGFDVNIGGWDAAKN